MNWTSVLEVTAVFTSDSIFSSARSVFLNARAQKGVRAVTKSNFWVRFDGANVIQKSWNLVCEHFRPSSIRSNFDPTLNRKFFFSALNGLGFWPFQLRPIVNIFAELTLAFSCACSVQILRNVKTLLSGRKTRFLVKSGHFGDFEAVRAVWNIARRPNIDTALHSPRRVLQTWYKT